MADNRRDPPVTRQEFDQFCRTVEGILAAGVDHRAPGEEAREEQTFWALRGLEDRTEDPAGAVLLAGSVEPRPGSRFVWQQTASTASLPRASSCSCAGPAVRSSPRWATPATPVSRTSIGN